MNIKDVAKLAGVSPSTVSRVVNGGDISAASTKTQKLIWDAVHETGYSPNQNAQRLKQKQSPPPIDQGRDIDCIYARVSGPHLDPFFTLLMHAVEVEAFARGYNLRYQYSMVDNASIERHCKNSQVDSAIILGRVDQQQLAQLTPYYKNLICVGLQSSDISVDQVISSGYRAAVTCVEYLHSLGHTQICYLGESKLEQRYNGYVQAMRDIDVDDVTPYVVETPFTPTGGYDAVYELVQRGQPFTAILCANDMLAVGTLKALKECRLRVPGDVSLIGINDMETVRYLNPMLTTISIPLDELGAHTAKILIDRIEGGHKLPVKVLLPGNIIIRESCALARSNSLSVSKGKK